MINHVVVKGNLTHDVDYKEVGERKTPLCKLRLAVNTNQKTADGFKEEVCFITATCWNKQAQICRDSLRKGSGVVVEGRLKYETWKDKDGNEKNTLTIQASSIVFADKDIKPGDNVGQQPAFREQPKPQGRAPQGDQMVNQRKQIKNDDEFDESLPF